jgi:hypothetical protein
MNQTFSIYGLVDPRYQEIRYVGYSKNPEHRFREHMRTNPRGSNQYKDRWIASLKRKGKTKARTRHPSSGCTKGRSPSGRAALDQGLPRAEMPIDECYGWRRRSSQPAEVRSREATQSHRKTVERSGLP